MKTIEVTAGEIMQSHHIYRNADEITRHDDNSYRHYEMTKGYRNFNLCDDGFYVHEDGERIKVKVVDEERLMLFINVYHIDQAYGGCEEGGWYYTVYDCRYTSLLIPDEEMGLFKYVEKELSKFRKMFNNEGRRPLSSVLSDGQWCVMLELTPAESQTRERPSYC